MTFQPTNNAVDAAFQTVSRAWNSHHQLRRSNPELAELYASRQRLDAARARARNLLRHIEGA